MTVIAVHLTPNDRTGKNHQNNVRATSDGSSPEKAAGIASARELQPGDVVRGRILQLLTNNKALISVLGKEIPVPLRTALPAGSEIIFTVLRAESKIELKMLEEGSKPESSKIQPETGRQSQNEIPSGRSTLHQTTYNEAKSRDLTANNHMPLNDKNEKELAGLLQRRDGSQQRQMIEKSLTSAAGSELEGIKREATVVLKDIEYPEIRNSSEKGNVDKGRLITLLDNSSKENTKANRPLFQSMQAPAATPTRTFPVSFEKDQILFEKGQIIKGAVIKMVSDKEAVLSFKNNTIPVILLKSASLNEEQTYKVVTAGRKPELIPVSPPAKNDDLSKGALAVRIASRTNMGEAVALLRSAVMEEADESAENSILKNHLKKLMRVVNTVVYDDRAVDKRNFFRNFLDRTGQNLENSLFKMVKNPNNSPKSFDQLANGNNVKSLALELLQAIGNSPENESRSLPRVVAAASALADTLETGQIVNNLAQARENVLYFQIPFVLQEQVSTGYLSMKFEEREQDARKDSHDISIVFFLDLTNLGGIRIDAGLSKDDRLKISILLENEKPLKFVRKKLPALLQRLSAQNITIDSIKAMTASRKKLEEGCKEDLRAGFFEAQLHVVV